MIQNAIEATSKAYREKGLKYVLQVFLYIASRKLKKTKQNLYRQYDLDFTPIEKGYIFHFIRSKKPSKNDLVVVPSIYLKELQSKHEATIIDTLSDKSLDLKEYERLIWATERCDRQCLIAEHFYDNNKKVLVIDSTGPSRNWMHDPIKEKICFSYHA